MVVENHQFLRVSSAAEIRDFNLIGVSLTKPMGDIAENTAVAKKGYELFMAVNIEGFMELIDDSCEWVMRWSHFVGQFGSAVKVYSVV